MCFRSSARTGDVLEHELGSGATLTPSTRLGLEQDMYCYTAKDTPLPAADWIEVWPTNGTSYTYPKTDKELRGEHQNSKNNSKKNAATPEKDKHATPDASPALSNASLLSVSSNRPYDRRASLDPQQHLLAYSDLLAVRKKDDQKNTHSDAQQQASAAPTSFPTPISPRPPPLLPLPAAPYSGSFDPYPLANKQEQHAPQQQHHHNHADIFAHQTFTPSFRPNYPLSSSSSYHDDSFASSPNNPARNGDYNTYAHSVTHLQTQTNNPTSSHLALPIHHSPYSTSRSAPSPQSLGSHASHSALFSPPLDPVSLAPTPHPHTHHLISYPSQSPMEQSRHLASNITSPHSQSSFYPQGQESSTNNSKKTVLGSRRPTAHEAL